MLTVHVFDGENHVEDARQAWDNAFDHRPLARANLAPLARDHEWMRLRSRENK
jgi:hypothetical protein